MGIATEPVVAEGGREGFLAAAQGVSLLVIGLSDRWRQEGLGPRLGDRQGRAGAGAVRAPGTRPGALAPRSDVTRFTWSSPGAADISLGPG